MPTHRIQLKGPWDVQRLDQNEPPVRVFMPAAWGEVFGGSPGRAQFRRKFNHPLISKPMNEFGSFSMELVERAWSELMAKNSVQSPLSRQRPSLKSRSNLRCITSC